VILRCDLERKASRTAQLLRQTLRGAGVHTLMPDPTSVFGSPTIRFQTPLGVSVAGTIDWSTPTTISIQMDTGEVDNGFDDDGDGRVDERMLVITRNVGTADEISTTVCRGLSAWAEGETGNGIDDNGNGLVDEGGFSVSRIGDLLYLRLTLEGRDESGQIVRHTTSTALVLHN
jgi:hypothetical protein